MKFFHDIAKDITLSRAPLTGFVAIGVTWSAFASQVPVIKAQIGASDAVYGAVVLVASFGALAAMWLAPLSDRFAGRFALVLGAVLIACGFMGVGGSSSILVFTLGMLVASAGSGIIDVLANADIAEIEARTGRALMNFNHGLYSFSYAGGALATGWLREAGWTPPYVFAILACLLGLLCLVMRRVAAVSVAHDDPARAVALPWGLVICGGCVVMVAFLAEAATEGWSALHLERTLGGGAAQGALGPAILGLTMGFGRLGGHWLGHRLPDVATMVGALLLCAFGLTLAGLAPTLALAYLGFGLGGLGMSVVGPLALGMLGRSVPAHTRLIAMSRASAISYFAFFIGPSLMGFVSQGFGLRVSFVVIAAVLLVVAVGLVPYFARQAAALKATL
jgi:MFS family permease